ncbi:hypothetical protein [Pedosphaera parvula]|uniref:Uncharacterized protein n=1 Tax=Pedosphaera parvula (strain Ellin514) TaxID=320771 RepID=B9XA21_PEDPL|nr:hypothetical protein [Pedosphaera parvula]EEF63362.1 hypothetical protein Cflav_PD5997 [Pedosphaera parvula Ellin514]
MNSKTVYLILQRASKGELPEQIGMNESLEEVGLYTALVDEGYLEGHVSLNEVGVPANVSGIRITFRGHQYLEQLRKEFDSQTLGLRFSKKVMIVIALIIGAAITGLVGLVIKFLERL